MTGPKPHDDAVAGFGRRWRRLDRLMQHAGDLDRPVASGAQQVERSDAGERAYFVLNGCAALTKERFDRVERSGRNCFKQSQAKCLGDR